MLPLVRQKCVKIC